MTDMMETTPANEQSSIQNQPVQAGQNGCTQEDSVIQEEFEVGPQSGTDLQVGQLAQAGSTSEPTPDGQEASQQTSDEPSPNKTPAGSSPNHHLRLEERVTILMAIAIAAKEYHPGEPKAKIGPDLCEYVRYLLDNPFFKGRVRKLSKNEFGRSPSNSTIISIYKLWHQDGSVAPPPRGGRHKDEEKLKRLQNVITNLNNKGDKLSIRKVAIEAGVSHAYASRYFKGLVKPPKTKLPQKKKTNSPKKTSAQKRKAKSPKKK